MPMMSELSIAAGILLLWFGGEYFVRGSVGLARRLNLSELMIGLTLVGFGTSLPEMTTSISAALSGAPGLSVGNVVGSNIANILLILGVAALIHPVVCQPTAFYRDAVALTLATLAATALILFGHIGTLSGLLLFAGLAGYILLTFLQERSKDGPAGEMLAAESEAAGPVPDSLFLTLISIAGGLAGVVGGAWLLVEGATALALSWGVSKTFIGLTIVAVGTSLPELVITAVASLKKQSDVALGNIIGSNMFNLLGILGVTALVTPIDVPPDLLTLDLAVMVGATAILIITAATSFKVVRWEACILLGGYIAYNIVRAQIAI